MRYDVFGLGNPLIDVIIPVQDQALQNLVVHKGSMNLVTHERQEEILKACAQEEKKHALGGSCANTMVMFSQLGGRSAFQGTAGNDAFSEEYERQLQAEGCTSFLIKEKGPTGSTVILVTPDAQRTMNTHLGKCRDLHPSQLHEEAISKAKYLYIEGYLWDTQSQQEAVMAAIKHAKQHGVFIALSLSDSFCVERHKAAFQNLLEKYVDLVFCNQDEAEHMTGEKDPKAMVQKLSQWCGQVALTIGKEGALVLKEGQINHVEGFPAKAVDTTGAGDSFAAGYLFGLVNGYSSVEAARLGNKAASIVVGQIGPRYQGNLREAVKEQLKG